MSRATILGGGPAGAVAALVLARAGAAVTLVEREAAAREKVCGEFLGADAAALLDGLGVGPGRLGAVALRQGRLASGERSAAFALPFDGWSLPRATLDEALLTAAAAAGATVLRGRAATAAMREDGGWTVRLADGGVLRSPTLVLATGKHDLRGHGRGTAGRPAYLGLKLPVRLRGAPGGVLVLPFRGGYAGLQPRAGGGANLCAAFAPGMAGEAARDGAALLARVAAGSALGAALLAGAVPLWTRPLAVAGVPYGFVHRDGPDAVESLYRIGDQFAVVPSLAGEGMAMALCGGVAAARAVLAGIPAVAFHRDLARRLVRPMRWAGAAAALLDAAPGTAVLGARLLPVLPRLVAARTRLPRTA